jgi:hypothetical protein
VFLSAMIFFRIFPLSIISSIFIQFPHFRFIGNRDVTAVFVSAIMVVHHISTFNGAPLAQFSQSVNKRVQATRNHFMGYSEDITL